ncbi:MAG: YdeI/OmpD-associated family protein [Actinomycetota bacterium]
MGRRTVADEFPVRTFPSREAWRKWLDEHHTDPGVWVKIAKKGSGIKSVGYGEAVEVALCYGWIDGLMRSVDDRYYKQRFTPRRARSNWSKINRVKALNLIASGEMQPPGLAEIERAKADGRWDAAQGPAG